MCVVLSSVAPFSINPGLEPVNRIGFAIKTYMAASLQTEILSQRSVQIVAKGKLNGVI